MRSFVLALALSLSAVPALAQTAPAPASDGQILLTVFLKHDQAMNLNEINEKLAKQGYYEKFPPAGVEVDSWYVVMGIGQVVTLRLPPRSCARSIAFSKKRPGARTAPNSSPPTTTKRSPSSRRRRCCRNNSSSRRKSDKLSSPGLTRASTRLVSHN